MHLFHLYLSLPPKPTQNLSTVGSTANTGDKQHQYASFHVFSVSTTPFITIHPPSIHSSQDIASSSRPSRLPRELRNAHMLLFPRWKGEWTAELSDCLSAAHSCLHSSPDKISESTAETLTTSLRRHSLWNKNTDGDRPSVSGAA